MTCAVKDASAFCVLLRLFCFASVAQLPERLWRCANTFERRRCMRVPAGSATFISFSFSFSNPHFDYENEEKGE